MTGSAGVFFVAGELARRDWVPSITPRGVEKTDILAQHSTEGLMVAIQVKTASAGYNLRLGVKNEAPARDWNEWFVFVALGEVAARPRFFIVPTNVVAAFLYVKHRVWLEGTKRDGSPRKDSAIRALSLGELAPYEGEWASLLKRADKAPIHLPDDVWERGTSDIGWPPGHPWREHGKGKLRRAPHKPEKGRRGVAIDRNLASQIAASLRNSQSAGYLGPPEWVDEAVRQLRGK